MPRLLKDRRLLAGLFAALVLAGAWLARPPAVTVVQVTPQAIREALQLTGRVETRHRATLSSLASGTVTRVTVEAGDAVQAGQLLALVSNPETEAALAQSDAALAQAEARRARLRDVERPTARADADNAALARDQAARQLQNLEPLQASQAVSAEQYRAARETLARAERDAQSAALRAQSLDGGRDWKLAEADVAQAAAARSVAAARQSQLRIVAPASGVIIARDIDPGAAVQAGTPLFLLAPRGAAAEIHVDVDERFLGLVSVGQPVTVIADAFPAQPLAAQVARIAPRVDADRGAIDVRIALASPPPWLREDMTVSVEILVGEKPAAPVLPLAAVRDLDSRPWAWCVQDDRARRCELTLGLRDEQRVEVLGGVPDGVAVVTDTRTLTENARVRPLADESN